MSDTWNKWPSGEKTVKAEHDMSGLVGSNGNHDLPRSYDLDMVLRKTLE